MLEHHSDLLDMVVVAIRSPKSAHIEAQVALFFDPFFAEFAI
jgi:hypothetical protein